MRWLVLACGLLLLTSCGGGKAEPEATPTPDPDAYLAQKGIITPLHQAIAGVAFRPFIPSRYIVETALLPPYNGGADTRQNDGIGFEYVYHNYAFALSQWPGAGMPGPRHIATINDCDISAYDINGGVGGKQGALWTNGRIEYNLVAAATAPNKAVFAEAKRLVHMGACR